MKSAEPKTKRTMPIATGQTGPKTSYGKAVVSLNALTHGLSSKSPRSLNDDERATFREARTRLEDEHDPKTAMEEFCVLQLAMCMVRMGRFWSVETAAINALSFGEKPMLNITQLSRYRMEIDKEIDGVLLRLQKMRIIREQRIEVAAKRQRVKAAQERSRGSSLYGG